MTLVSIIPLLSLNSVGLAFWSSTPAWLPRQRLLLAVLPCHIGDAGRGGCELEGREFRQRARATHRTFHDPLRRFTRKRSPSWRRQIKVDRLVGRHIHQDDTPESGRPGWRCGISNASGEFCTGCLVSIFTCNPLFHSSSDGKLLPCACRPSGAKPSRPILTILDPRQNSTTSIARQFVFSCRGHSLESTRNATFRKCTLNAPQKENIPDQQD